MRVSVEEHDPGYRNEATTGKYEAYLDGEKVEMCITADEDQGYIKKYKLDSEGEPIVNRQGDSFWVETEELYGIVKIKEVDV